MNSTQSQQEQGLQGKMMLARFRGALLLVVHLQGVPLAARFIVGDAEVVRMSE